MDLVEILSFLFQLSFSTLGKVSRELEGREVRRGSGGERTDLRTTREGKGWRGHGLGSDRWVCRSPRWPSLHQDYSVEGMSDSLLNFLQHLREFGLVFQRKVCTPSHLASGRVGCWVAAERLSQD